MATGDKNKMRNHTGGGWSAQMRHGAGVNSRRSIRVLILFLSFGNALRTESAVVIQGESTNSGPDQNHWKPFLRVTTYMVNELSDQFPSGAPQNSHIRMLWYSEGTWMWVWRSPVWICGTSLRTNFPEKPFQGYVHGGSPPATNPSLDLRGWGLPVNVWVGSKGSYFLGWGSCRFDQCSSLTSSLFNTLYSIGVNRKLHFSAKYNSICTLCSEIQSPPSPEHCKYLYLPNAEIEPPHRFACE